VALALALGGGAAAAQEDASGAKEFWNHVFERLPASGLSVAESFPAYCVERALAEGLLRPGSKVLDLAMGDGRFAVHFARKGLDVTGLDISPVAIAKARAAAAAAGVELATVEADLFAHDLGDGRWDLVANIYYNPAIKVLDRIQRAVRPGGLLLIEGFAADHTGGGPPPWSRYKPNQLLEALPGWRILEYEDGRFPSAWAGDRRVPVVRLLARKPGSQGP
jgi:SAM-dependent methyltransferase